MFRQWPDCGAGLRLCKKYALRRKPGRRRLPSPCPSPARLSSCSRVGRGAKRAARLIPFPQGSAVKAQVKTGRGGPCACMRASPAQAASSPHPLRGRQSFFSRPIFYDMLRTAKTCLRISAAKKKRAGNAGRPRRRHDCAARPRGLSVLFPATGRIS